MKKRLHLVVVLLLASNLGSETVSYQAPREVGPAAETARAWGNGYDTAIEVHQGGQDGGGALW
jgi:hypothetical protein